ncbi:MAG: tRNA (adenosine(37)-N6)-dimethylallyltransferase MiaA [Bacteroidota bacterium]
MGPTAVGKTGISLAVAEALKKISAAPVEIVSIDSRQVYRQLSIGTAKPSREERGGIVHHFIDELDPSDSYSAGRFAADAEQRVAAILERGALPLFVGGSTLYLEALVHGIADIPASRPGTRAHFKARLQSEGASALYDELRATDPAAAASMDASKSQRIVRALEVLSDTGRRISDWQQTAPPPRFSYAVHVLTRPRPELYARIEARVDAMLKAGLLDEVQALLDAGYAQNAPALATIGYREPLAYLRGDIEYGRMVALLKRNSRRYAKRQLTWFRRHSSYAWIDVSAMSAEDVLSNLISRRVSPGH